jgi:tetratricopeptide (TPR) repeat protein
LNHRFTSSLRRTCRESQGRKPVGRTSGLEHSGSSFDRQSPQTAGAAICATRLFALILLVVVPIRHVFGQEGKGCEGVAFARHEPRQYTLVALQKRVERNPPDLDAIIHLGLHMEEIGKIEKADNLYLRAIRARPDCYLGYYFAGLVEERISDHLRSESLRKINKALALDPSLRDDPNVRAFLARHPSQTRTPTPKPGVLRTPLGELVASANRFWIGVGAGFLLAAPLLFFLRRKRAGPL